MDAVLLEFQTGSYPRTKAPRIAAASAVKLHIQFPQDAETESGSPISIWHRGVTDDAANVEGQLLDGLETARATVLPGLMRWVRCGSEGSSPPAEFTMAAHFPKWDVSI